MLQNVYSLPVTRDDTALTQFSLVGGEGGGANNEDDTQTREILDEELSLLMGQPVEGEREERERGKMEAGRERMEGGTARHRDTRRVIDPGMSVLQDSVLGMTPDGELYLHLTVGLSTTQTCVYSSIMWYVQYN